METDLRNRRVLVVDDDDRLRALIVRHLNDAGMDARGVPDARQMHRWLEREHQDLIVLDLMLPDDDGLRVCSRLRAEGNDVPVLMLTAKGDDVDRILGLEVGADDGHPEVRFPPLAAAVANGEEKSDSTSLQRECSARACSRKNIYASRALREMIARPKTSRNEWEMAEI